MIELLHSQSTQGAAMGRKRIGIEALLAWAYRFELPKSLAGTTYTTIGMRSGWGGVERYGELMTIVDVSPNWFGCTPDLWTENDGGPHADALIVADAVADLAETTMDWEEGVDVLADITMLTDAERADCNRRGYAIAGARGQGLAALVMRRAMIGGAPDWEGHGEVERKIVSTPNGQPLWFRFVERSEGEGRAPVLVEVDGRDLRTRRPHDDAFRKTFLAPDPALLAAERIDYQAWVHALGFLAERLGDLDAHQVIAPTRVLWPWDGQADRGHRARIFVLPPVVAAMGPKKSTRRLKPT